MMADKRGGGWGEGPQTPKFGWNICDHPLITLISVSVMGMVTRQSHRSDRDRLKIRRFLENREQRTFKLRI